MRSASARLVLIAAAIAAAGPLRAGGNMDFGGDSGSMNDGPSYFGFVRDASGSVVGDAKVTASVKSGGAVVTRTNSMGVYKIPGFAKDIDPNTVTISCAKDGYKQTDALRRPPSDPKDPIETECTLQKD